MNSIFEALRAQGPNCGVHWDTVNATAREILDRIERLRQSAEFRLGERILSMDQSPATVLVMLALNHDLKGQLILGRSTLDFKQVPGALQPSLIIHSHEKIERISTQPPEPGPTGIFLMTSGTTGTPKIVHHTLPALLGRVQTGGLKKNANARWLLTYETHSFAGLQVVLSATLSGGFLAGTSSRTLPILADLARYQQITHISGTPTFWRALMMVLRHEGLPCLRQITIGGEAVDQSTLNQLMRMFPVARISQIYASTEAGALFAVHDGRAGFPRAWLDEELQGGIRLRVTESELEVKSPRRMVSYASGQTIQITADGWLRTGDIVVEKEDRVLFCGRRDSMLNVGGLKVFPEHVEAFLLELPMIAEAQVYAIPSPLTGSLVGARVVFRPEYDETAIKDLQAACAASLPRHMQPRKFEVVPSIQIGNSGKKERQ